MPKAYWEPRYVRDDFAASTDAAFDNDFCRYCGTECGNREYCNECEDYLANQEG